MACVAAKMASGQEREEECVGEGGAGRAVAERREKSERDA